MGKDSLGNIIKWILMDKSTKYPLNNIKLNTLKKREEDKSLTYPNKQPSC